ncbi:hypothetical protein ABT354_08260 [Streptomyces sp. NPDC000594]|uniref:hypothetical protein n=1 Tax=Streptomyces sp. NPDC000594 TaxID=3154261 RepID=UPI00331BFD50
MNGLSGPLLYARSRRVPVTLAVLTAAALLTFWWGDPPSGRGPAFPGPAAWAWLAGPLLAAVAIGAALHSDSAELDRTAARPGWLPRAAQLLGLTVFAVAAAAVTSPLSEEGATLATTARVLLGAVGLAAAGAVPLGARLSWLPPLAYLVTVPLVGPLPEGSPVVWSWPLRPDGDTGAWLTALALLAAGTALAAWRGPRPEGRR